MLRVSIFNTATDRRGGPFDREREFDLARSHIRIKKQMTEDRRRTIVIGYLVERNETLGYGKRMKIGNITNSVKV